MRDVRWTGAEVDPYRVKGSVLPLSYAPKWEGLSKTSPQHDYDQQQRRKDEQFDETDSEHIDRSSAEGRAAPRVVNQIRSAEFIPVICERPP